MALDRITILEKLVDIDRHTDVIKDNMRLIVKAQVDIAVEMQAIGKLYVGVLELLKED